MIASRALLTDLRNQVGALEVDLRQQAEGDLSEVLRVAWQDARESWAGRARGYKLWLTEQVSQSAIAWVLATVFARFCEDNRLMDAPFLVLPRRPTRSCASSAAGVLRTAS